MTSFPTSFGRAPTMMLSQQSLSLLSQTSYEIFRVSQQLSTGLAILRPSDNAVKAATIAVLDARLERSEQVLSNLGMADKAIEMLDQALAEALDIVNQAKSIALEQVGSTNTASDRKAQSVIIDSLINSMLGASMRQSTVGYVFGGTTPGTVPIQEIGGAYRFMGSYGGLLTDLGSQRSIPVTLGAQNALGALSNRVEGSVDLDPNLTMDTKLADLGGARGLGITSGVFEFSFNGDDPVRVDISDAETVGDVIDRITAAVQQYETDSGNTVLGPGGISISGGAITLDIDSGSLEFMDTTGGVTAADLGLATKPSNPFTISTSGGQDLDPKLTWTTPISELAGLGGTGLTSIKLNNNGKANQIDLSSVKTLGQLRSALEAGNTGVRVEISDDGSSINIVTEIAGGADRAMSIEEVDDGTNTATLLGIRSLSRDTRLADFNDGRGVSVVTGGTDPTTGFPDPALDVDFVITLGDGFEISIDLSESDTTTVGAVIDAINAQADAALTAAGRPTSDFSAGLSNSSNGLVLSQDPVLGSTMTVVAKNQSKAAEQLGLRDGTFDAASGELLGEDRAKVRVDNLFTHLIDLADALRNNDTIGIEIASGKLDEAIERLTQTRGLVGGYAQRIGDEMIREEDRQLMDIAVRSQFRDLDYAEAATRFSMLQTQLQAGLMVTAQSSSMSLLDFLG